MSFIPVYSETGIIPVALVFALLLLYAYTIRTTTIIYIYRFADIQHIVDDASSMKTFHDVEHPCFQVLLYS